MNMDRLLYEYLVRILPVFIKGISIGQKITIFPPIFLISRMRIWIQNSGLIRIQKYGLIWIIYEFNGNFISFHKKY